MTILRLVTVHDLPRDHSWPTELRVPVRGDWIRLAGEFLEVQMIVWEMPEEPTELAATVTLSDPFRA